MDSMQVKLPPCLFVERPAPSGAASYFLLTFTSYRVDVYVLIHARQPAVDSDQTQKALGAAQVDPDVTAVMDGCGAAAVATCLF